MKTPEKHFDCPSHSAHGTHAHTHKHKQPHQRSRHTHAQTHKHKHTHTRSHAQAQAHAHTLTRTSTSTRTHAHTHKHMQPHQEEEKGFEGAWSNAGAAGLHALPAALCEPTPLCLRAPHRTCTNTRPLTGGGARA